MTIDEALSTGKNIRRIGWKAFTVEHIHICPRILCVRFEEQKHEFDPAFQLSDEDLDATDWEVEP